MAMDVGDVNGKVAASSMLLPLLLFRFSLLSIGVRLGHSPRSSDHIPVRFFTLLDIWVRYFPCSLEASPNAQCKSVDPVHIKSVLLASYPLIRIGRLTRGPAPVTVADFRKHRCLYLISSSSAL